MSQDSTSDRGRQVMGVHEEAVDPVDAVGLWLHGRAIEGFAGCSGQGDLVVVRWKGEPPMSLRRFVGTLGVDVRFEPAMFSHEELLQAAARLIDRFPGVVSSAGVAEDAAGIKATLLPTAAVDEESRRRNVERLQESVRTTPDAVPLTVTGVSGPFQYPEAGMGPIALGWLSPG